MKNSSTHSKARALFLISCFFIQLSAWAQTCLNPLDIHIANDISGSVDATEYYQSKSFVTQLGLSFTLGNGSAESRIGISQWSKSYYQKYSFPAAGATFTTSAADVVAYVNSTRPASGGTDPYTALLNASQWVLENPVPGRAGQPIIVLMTDATCRQISSNINTLAFQIKNRGINIVVMAIGGASSCTALQGTNVASPGGYFSAATYSQLQANALTYINSIQAQFCTVSSPVADLSVGINSFEITNCTTTPAASVNYTVTNSGLTAFNGTLDVSFYNGDPTDPNTQYLFTESSTQSIAASGGTYIGSSSNAALVNAGTLYAVVNIDGSLPANAVPISPNFTGITLTDATEEQTANNISSAFTRTNGVDCVPYAHIDVAVGTSGQVCDNNIIYTATVCNTGTAAYTIDGDPISGITPYTTPSGALTLVGSPQIVGNNPYIGNELPAGACVTYQFTYNLDNATPATTYNFSVDVKEAPGTPTGYTVGDYIKASNTGINDFFGYAIAISGDGNTMAVGAYNEDGSGTGVNPADNNAEADAGAVYVYTRSGGTWIFQAYIKADNPGQNDLFGASVALSDDGNTLAVGAPGENGTGAGVNPAYNSAGNGLGAVYIYTRTGAVWSFQAYIKASNSGDSDAFGHNVVLSGDGNTLAVGAPQEDGSGTGVNPADNNAATDAGAVYVYSRTGSVWSFQAYIKASNTGAGDIFGQSIAISADGNTLAVGTRQEDGSGTGVNPADNNAATNAGAAYVYTRSGSVWSFQAYIKASNTGAGDIFGQSIAISADGNTLAVGAFLEDGSGTGVNPADNNAATDAGAAYVYSRTGGFWSFQAYIKASNTGVNDYTGYAVALSADGNILAVGSYSEDGSGTGVNPADNNGLSGAGAVYVYNRSGSIWSFQDYIKASNTDDGDRFGTALALGSDGNTLAVGAFDEDGSGAGVNPADNNAASNAGAVYTYYGIGGTSNLTTYSPSENFTLGAATGLNGYDGTDASNTADDFTYSAASAACAPGDLVSLSMTLSPATCPGEFSTATLTITNNTGVVLRNTTLGLNLTGTDAVFNGEPYNLTNGIVLSEPNIFDPAYPAVPYAISGSSGAQGLRIYTLPTGVSTIDVDIVLGSAQTDLGVAILEIPTTFNAGGFAFATAGITPSTLPTITGTCPADVTIAATTLTLSYSASGASNVQWTSGTNGSFADATSATTTYIINDQDRANGYVALSLQALSATGCDASVSCNVLVTGATFDYGDAPATYDLNENAQPVAAGASLSANVYLGSTAPSSEANTKASALADGDGAEEDAMANTTIQLNSGPTYTQVVTVTNNSTEDAYLNGFFDWNDDGDFIGDEDENAAQVVIPASSGTQSYNVVFNVPASYTYPQLSRVMRLRLGTDEFATAKPYGVVANGEVEDFLLDVTNDPCDLGFPGTGDNDGDGIADFCDLDDDNDGILDVNEITVVTTDYTSLVNNPSFELPLVSNFATITPNGWAGTAQVIESGSAIWGSPIAPDGNQLVGLQNGQSIEQTITLTDNRFYQLSVFIADRPGNAQTADVLVNGSLAGTLDASSTSFVQTTIDLGQFAGGSITLTLQGTNLSGDNTLFIDHLTLLGSEVVAPDSDGDGIGDGRELDSDNDGIADIIEAGGVDADNDGLVDGFTDANGDGLDDTIAANPLPDTDTDGDGIYPNRIDIDSDNDGIADVIEAQPTTGYVAPTGSDTDGDGIDDAFDTDQGGSFISLLEDTDGDTTPDMFDDDSDGDGVNDLIEAYDGNQDGVLDALPGTSSTDIDGDGLQDRFEDYDLSSLPSLPGTSSTNATNNGQVAASPFPKSVLGTTTTPNVEPNWRLKVLWWDEASDTRWEDAAGALTTLDDINFTDYYLVIDEVGTAILTNGTYAKVKAVEVQTGTDREFDVEGCLEVTDYVRNDGTMRLTSTTETSYGQYLGPEINNLEAQMAMENSGWHNIAFPVTVTAGDFDTQNNSPDPLLVNLTGDPLTHNLWSYNSTISGGKEIGFYRNGYSSHAYGTWQMVTTGTLSGAYNFYIGPFNTNSAAPIVKAIGTSRSNNVITSTSNAFGGWNLIPNPYPVSLDFDAMYDNGNPGNFFEDLDKAVWLWDAADTYEPIPGITGSYVLYDPVSGQSISNGTDLPNSDANTGYIPPYQSFWVRRTGSFTTRRIDADGTVSPGATALAVGIGATDDPDVTEALIDVTVKPEHRAICVQPRHYKTSPDVIKLRVTENMNLKVHDETLLSFGEGFTEGYDEGYDIFRISAAQGAPFMASEVQGKALAINRLPYPTKNTHVPLSFVAEENGKSYSISLTDQPVGWRIYLEDRLNGNWQELSNGGSYSFINNTSFRPQRFVLHFNKTGALIAQPAPGIVAWATTGGIEVKFDGITNENAEIYVSNLIGQTLFVNKAVSTASNFIIPINEADPQVYFVTVVSDGQTKTIKVVK